MSMLTCTRSIGLSTLLALSALAHATHAEEDEVVVIKAGRVITAAGDDIDDGEIVIVNGEISLVGTRLEYPAGARIIDAREETVMPGMIHPHTRLGLRDWSRNGTNGEITVEDELYWSLIDVEPWLQAGYTAAAVYPPGSGLTGVASVYRLAGAEADRRIGPEAYARLTMTNPARDKGTLRGAITKAKSEIEKEKKAREEWEKKQEEARKQAEQQKQQEEQEPGEGGDQQRRPRPGMQDEQAEEQKESEQFKPPQLDASVMPIIRLLKEEKNAPSLLIAISSASDLLHLDDALDDDELPHHLMLNAGFSLDYHHVLDALSARKGLLLTGARLGTITQTATRYNLPAALAGAGAADRLVLMPAVDSNFEIEHFRSRIADLVRSGLSREDAIRAVTINAAKLVRQDAKFGAIEKGKAADLVFLDGDAVDPLAEVTRVMINGDIVWTAED